MKWEDRPTDSAMYNMSVIIMLAKRIISLHQYLIYSYQGSKSGDGGAGGGTGGDDDTGSSGGGTSGGTGVDSKGGSGGSCVGSNGQQKWWQGSSQTLYYPMTSIEIRGEHGCLVMCDFPTPSCPCSHRSWGKNKNLCLLKYCIIPN